MTVKEIMEKTGLSWEAIASQLPKGSSLDTNLDPALETALLAKFGGDRGSGRLKSALPPKPETETQIKNDLTELCEENKITIADAILVSELHQVTLDYVVGVAETLELDETVLAFLRGYVQQERLLAAEQTGRAAAIAKQNKQVRDRLDIQESGLEQFGLERFQERIGFNLQQFFDQQAEEEKKYRAKAQSETMQRVLAAINNGV